LKGKKKTKLKLPKKGEIERGENSCISIKIVSCKKVEVLKIKKGGI